MPEVTPLQPDDPRRAGRYRLTGRVEGMAGPDLDSVVYQARGLEGGTVLVTTLGAARAPDPASRDRFTAEARLARRIAPFCAARVLDAGLDGLEPFLVMEHIPGPTLLETVEEDGPLPAGTVVAVAIGAATGLAAIHQTGLVHGRFNPSCVVLSPGGLRVMHVSITPPYGAATPAADMLAWAHTVLFAALGRPVRDSRDLARLPGPLQAPVTACLSPDPAARPAARALLSGLLGARAAGGGGLLAEGARYAEAAAIAPARAPAAPAPLAQRRARARPPRGLIWAGLSGLAAVVVVAGVLFAARGPAIARSPGGSPSPLGRIPAVFAGHWAGTVHQTNPALTVNVTLDLAAGQTQGAISYPALHCSGQVVVVGYGNRTLTVRQLITSGQRNCVDGLITLLPQRAGKVVFTFRRPGDSSPTGILAKS